MCFSASVGKPQVSRRWGRGRRVLTCSLCPPPSSSQRSEWNRTDWWEEEKRKRGGSVGGLAEAEPEGPEGRGRVGGAVAVNVGHCRQ